MEEKLITKPIRFFAGRVFPHKTGGERYNFHLISAAESLGLKIDYATLTDMPFYKILGRGPLWRLRHLWACFYLSFKAYIYSGNQLFFDVWLAPYLFPWELFTKKRCWLMVHHLRGHLQHTAWKRKWISWCERLMIKKAAKILTVSNASKQQIQHWVSETTSISVISPAFDRINVESSNSSYKEKKTFSLLYVGAMVRDKGVIDLLRALIYLPDQPAWVLNLVGKLDAEPDTLLEIHRIKEQLGEKSNRVVIHGWLETKALQEIYSISDVFVLPSYWEGYGIVFLEAMACGIPVISYNTGAIPEVVNDGKTGILVPLKDIQGLAGAIIKLIKDEQLRKHLGEEGRKFASHHKDWQDMESQCKDWFLSGT